MALSLETADNKGRGKETAEVIAMEVISKSLTHDAVVSYKRGGGKPHKPKKPKGAVVEMQPA